MSYRTTVNRDGIELVTDWKTIRQWKSPKDGSFLLFYQCKATSNVRHNVLVSFRMKVNGSTVMQTGYNISWAAHYGCYTLPYVGSFLEGDLVEVQARAASAAGMPDYAAMIPREGTEHESLIVVEIPGYFYISSKLN